MLLTIERTGPADAGENVIVTCDDINKDYVTQITNEWLVIAVSASVCSQRAT